MKKVKLIGAMCAIALMLTGTANATPVDDGDLICGDVTFECGLTGTICGVGVQGVIDRFEEAEAQVCAPGY